MPSKKWFVDFTYYISIVALLLAFTLITTGVAMSRKMSRRIKIKKGETSNTLKDNINGHINGDNSDSPTPIGRSQPDSIAPSKSNSLTSDNIDTLSILANRGSFRRTPNDKDQISTASSISSFMTSLDNMHAASSLSSNSGGSVVKISSTGSLKSKSGIETISDSNIESNIQSPSVSALLKLNSKTDKDAVNTEQSNTHSRSSSLKQSITAGKDDIIKLERLQKELNLLIKNDKHVVKFMEDKKLIDSELDLYRAKIEKHKIIMKFMEKYYTNY